jgi:hypothetical protein
LIFLLARYIQKKAPGITVKVIGDWPARNMNDLETRGFLKDKVGLDVSDIYYAKNYVILIDEAHRTYSNTLLWGEPLLKECINGGAKFVLFGSYGSPGGRPSELIDSLYLKKSQRISLHHSGDPPVGLLLTKAEAVDLVDRICNTNIASPKLTEELRDNLIDISGHHAGALERLVHVALDKVFQSQISACKPVHQPTI